MRILQRRWCLLVVSCSLDCAVFSDSRHPQALVEPHPLIRERGEHSQGVYPHGAHPVHVCNEVHLAALLSTIGLCSHPDCRRCQEIPPASPIDNVSDRSMEKE
jgi:hypothetical protein